MGWYGDGLATDDAWGCSGPGLGAARGPVAREPLSCLDPVESARGNQRHQFQSFLARQPIEMPRVIVLLDVLPHDVSARQHGHRPTALIADSDVSVVLCGPVQLV